MIRAKEVCTLRVNALLLKKAKLVAIKTQLIEVFTRLFVTHTQLGTDMTGLRRTK